MMRASAPEYHPQPNFRKPGATAITWLDEHIGDLASFQLCSWSLWRLPAEILKSCLAETDGLVPFMPQASLADSR